MENFFERVGRFWPAGRRDVHWHILPTPVEAAALIAPYQGLFPLGLENVPVSGVHCTLLHAVGLSATDVDTGALIEDAADYARTVSPFTLTFDRPAVGNAGMEIGGWPGQPVFTGIVDAVTRATTRTGADFRASRNRYPHLSLAYASRGAEDVDAVAIRTALSAISQPLSGTVFVDRLHLVEQWHNGAHITFSPIAQVPLAGVTV